MTIFLINLKFVLIEIETNQSTLRIVSSDLRRNVNKKSIDSRIYSTIIAESYPRRIWPPVK